MLTKDCDEMQPSSPKAFIQLRGITKAYDEGSVQRVVFDSLSADLEGFAVTALMGRSGTGKSTLLNLICGIDLPDTGEVLVGGVTLNQMPEKDRTLYRRHHIGFVFQFFNLIPTLTVEENLLLPLDLLGEARDAARSRVRHVLESVGLVNRYSSFPDRLSGGEQQRVAVARALVHKPALVLADEPTGNLDIETGREILELLVRLSRDEQKTVVMATHSEEAAGFADHVFTVADAGLRPRRREDGLGPHTS